MQKLEKFLNFTIVILFAFTTPLVAETLYQMSKRPQIVNRYERAMQSLCYKVQRVTGDSCEQKAVVHKKKKRYW